MKKMRGRARFNGTAVWGDDPKTPFHLPEKASIVAIRLYHIFGGERARCIKMDFQHDYAPREIGGSLHRRDVVFRGRFTSLLDPNFRRNGWASGATLLDKQMLNVWSEHATMPSMGINKDLLRTLGEATEREEGRPKVRSGRGARYPHEHTGPCVVS